MYWKVFGGFNVVKKCDSKMEMVEKD